MKLPNGNGFSVKYPIAKGDLVTLHWCHKDLNDWLDSSGDEDVTIAKTKIYNLEDCWITHGFGTRKSHQNPSATDLIVEGDSTTLTITPEGVVTLVTDGTTTITSEGHTVNADTQINGNLSVSGNASIDQNLTVSGNADVAQNVTITGTTDITGILTAASGVLAASYAGIGGGAATFAVDMNVTGTVATVGSITVNGVALESHVHTDSDGGTTSSPY